VESTHLREKRHNFAPGDNVEVTDGELANLRGRIQSIDGDKVVILPEHEDLTVRKAVFFYIYTHLFLKGAIDTECL
jgi:transcription antitermination factor NusG